MPDLISWSTEVSESIGYQLSGFINQRGSARLLARVVVRLSMLQ